MVPPPSHADDGGGRARSSLPGSSAAPPPSRSADVAGGVQALGDSPCCCAGARRDGSPQRGAARPVLMAACSAVRGSEPAVDEFTVPAEKSRLLERSRGRIESLFQVRLAVLGAQGDWRPAIAPPAPARIWVQLKGSGKAVRSAKVRGSRGKAGSGTQACCGGLVAQAETRAMFA